MHRYRTVLNSSSSDRKRDYYSCFVDVALFHAVSSLTVAISMSCHVSMFIPLPSLRIRSVRSGSCPHTNCYLSHDLHFACSCFKLHKITIIATGLRSDDNDDTDNVDNDDTDDGDDMYKV